MRSNWRTVPTTSVYMLCVKDIGQNGNISEVRSHAGANFGKKQDAYLSIARCSQSSRQNCTGGVPPPRADSPPRDFLMTICILKETVIFHKKEFRKKKRNETCSHLSFV